MEKQSANVPLLRRAIIDDIFRSLGPSGQGLPRKFLTPFVWPSAHQFSKLAARFDQIVERTDSICEAMRQILPRFVNSVNIYGAENIPQDGPLLIVSNHPGSFDEFVIASSLPRDDLNIVAGGFPFLRKLPNTRRHLIFTSDDLYDRVYVVRDIIRKLEKGIALLIFPSGAVDPDPAILPGAKGALETWSRSVELILRRVPQTQVVVTMVSGVLSPSVMNHRFVKFFKDIHKQQKVAETIQLMQQMFFPQKYNLVPKISFEEPFTTSDLKSEMDSPQVMQSIIDIAQRSLDSHMSISTPLHGIQ